MDDQVTDLRFDDTRAHARLLRDTVQDQEMSVRDASWTDPYVVETLPQHCYCAAQ